MNLIGKQIKGFMLFKSINDSASFIKFSGVFEIWNLQRKRKGGLCIFKGLIAFFVLFHKQNLEMKIYFHLCPNKAERKR